MLASPVCPKRNDLHHFPVLLANTSVDFYRLRANIRYVAQLYDTYTCYVPAFDSLRLSFVHAGSATIEALYIVVETIMKTLFPSCIHIWNTLPDTLINAQILYDVKKRNKTSLESWNRRNGNQQIAL